MTTRSDQTSEAHRTVTTQPPHVLTILAHPDDESFGLAGTFATLTDRGFGVTLVCATRGEVGEILVEGLATRETLGELREAELRTAMAHVGVRDIRLLGFRDSGMAGTEENADPRAFVNADHDAVVETLVGIISELKPAAVTTFGPDGVYGHPDHIRAHEVALAAVLRAAELGVWEVPVLYYAAASRQRVQEFAKYPGSPFSSMTPDVLATFGTPDEDISTRLDISAQVDRKWAAIKAHRSQVGDGDLFPGLPREVIEQFTRYESLRIVPLPWNPEPRDVLEELTA